MAQVFISHSSADKEHAKAVVKYLENRGISCWASFRNIPPGVNFADVIPPAIRECPAFVILISRNSVASREVAKELNLAARRAGSTGKLILPLMLEDIVLPDNFDYHLADIQNYRHYASPDAALESIWQELRKTLPNEEYIPLMSESNADDCRQIADNQFREGNFESAAKWYRQAVELMLQQLNHAIPQPTINPEVEEWFQRGLSYFDTGDYKNAVAWYLKAAEQGHPIAQDHLGRCYQNGFGVTRDAKAAVTWYQKAADIGYADAQYHLGCLYYFSQYISKPPKFWLMFAAAQGHVDAQFELAKHLYSDPKVSTIWFHRAAVNGHAEAQYTLALRYQSGIGTAQNTEAAIFWYHRAAEQEYTQAQIALGYLYESGYIVAQDLNVAFAWFYRAAKNGDSLGQYQVAAYYEYGNGVEQNLEEAKKWYQTAYENGKIDAQLSLERLK